MDFVLVGIAQGLGYATLTIYMAETQEKDTESEHGKKHRKLW